MKKNNLFRIMWIIGIYAILVVLLYLVIMYKVGWEDKDLNKYLYFYDCNNNLCSSDTEVSNYYSKVLCHDRICPYIEGIVGNNLLLKSENNSYIFDYINDKIINNSYTNYRYLDYNLYIATDSDGTEGVIDDQGNVIIEPFYNYINDYDSGYIAYKENELYSIKKEDDSLNISNKYKNVVLINNKYYGAIKEKKYQIFTYDEKTVNEDSYDYMFSSSGVTLVVSDNKIDFLNSELKPTLIMKIPTFYSYNTTQEINTLNVYSDGKYIYFRLYINKTQFRNYKYDIKNFKILSME